jgi:DNA mismatch endonuclease, patch repair protein
MSRIRSTNTGPEKLVRSMLHKQGYRFRLHRRDLPGTPDIVFPSRKAVIFVHGCFWHQHTALRCSDARVPKSNRGYWVEKLQANVARDKRDSLKLRKMGWAILVVWECELRRISQLQRRLTAFLAKRVAA